MFYLQILDKLLRVYSSAFSSTWCPFHKCLELISVPFPLSHSVSNELCRRVLWENSKNLNRRYRIWTGGTILYMQYSIDSIVFYPAPAVHTVVAMEELKWSGPGGWIVAWGGRTLCTLHRAEGLYGKVCYWGYIIIWEIPDYKLNPVAPVTQAVLYSV